MINHNGIITFVILVLFSITSYASDITTVNISNGVISITGNGFGSKPTQVPKAYFNFDSGSVDAPLSEAGMNDEYELYTYKPGISGNSAYTLESAGGAGAHLDYYAGAQTKVLVTAWVKLNVIRAETEAEGYCQLKFLEFGNGQFAATSSAGYVSYPWLGELSSGVYGWTQFCRDITKHSNTYSTYGYHDTIPYPTNNTWIRFEWMMNANSNIGVEDGTIIDRWIFPSQNHNQLVWSSTSVSTHNTGDIPWQYFLIKMDIENVLAADAGVVALNIDDLYIETGGWWHVEIGNAETWGTETNRFIQPIQTYSNTTVSTTYNRGNLPDGVAYLWVVDGNGIPSDQDLGTVGYQGYPVTIGSSSVGSNIINVESSQVEIQ